MLWAPGTIFYPPLQTVRHSNSSCPSGTFASETSRTFAFCRHSKRKCLFALLWVCLCCVFCVMSCNTLVLFCWLGVLGVLLWYIIKIQLGSEILWPRLGFEYVCTVAITSEIWPWVKIMTHLGSWTNCVKYYPDPTWQYGVMALTRIYGIHVCALWPWPWRYNLESRSWHTLGSWTIVVNIIQIQLGSKELWPGHGFPVYVHCDLDLGDMILSSGQGTPLGHGQQLCEILSRSNLEVRNDGQDTDFQYVCTVTLTLVRLG